MLTVINYNYFAYSGPAASPVKGKWSAFFLHPGGRICLRLHPTVSWLSVIVESAVLCAPPVIQAIIDVRRTTTSVANSAARYVMSQVRQRRAVLPRGASMLTVDRHSQARGSNDHLFPAFLFRNTKMAVSAVRARTAAPAPSAIMTPLSLETPFLPRNWCR